MMKTVQKKKLRFNLFDILLILLILAAIGGGIFYFTRAGAIGTAEKTVTAHYTILIKDIPVSMRMPLEQGQNVINSVDKNSIGTIVSAEMKPCVYDQYDKTTGTLYHGAHEDFHNVELTIEAKAIDSEKDYLIDNMHVSIGTMLYFRTAEFVGSGYVIDFRVVDTPVFPEKED